MWLEWGIGGDKVCEEPKVLRSPHPQVPTILDPRQWVWGGRMAHASLSPRLILLGFS